ncbi:MAG: hypothetical protein WA810_14145 [Maribacter sp.]
MKFPHVLPLLSACILIFACSSESNPEADETEIPPVPQETYFPSTSPSSDWESLSLASLGWNENESEALVAYLAESNTDAFLMLKDGRIVI